jgi:transcriptional regulator with XRE-family HTH domain
MHMEAAPLNDPKALANRLRDELGVSTGYASDLANGNRSPSLRLALEIQEKLLIPPTAWPRPKTKAPDTQQGQAA